MTKATEIKTMAHYVTTLISPQLVRKYRGENMRGKSVMRSQQGWELQATQRNETSTTATSWCASMSVSVPEEGIST